MDILGQENYRQCNMESAQTPALGDLPTPPAEGGGGELVGRNVCGHLDTWVVGPRYQIVRVLGRGSYGEVVEAIDKRYG